MKYYLYLQFTNGNEGYYSYEANDCIYLAETDTADYGIFSDIAVRKDRAPAIFPSQQAAASKARRLCAAGYRIAYWEVV